MLKNKSKMIRDIIYLFVTLAGIFLAFNLSAFFYYSNSLDSTHPSIEKTYVEIRNLMELTSGHKPLEMNQIETLGTNIPFYCTDQPTTYGNLSFKYTLNYCNKVGYTEELSKRDPYFKIELVSFAHLNDFFNNEYAPAFDEKMARVFVQGNERDSFSLLYDHRKIADLVEEYAVNIKQRIKIFNDKEQALTWTLWLIAAFVVLGLLWAYLNNVKPRSNEKSKSRLSLINWLKKEATQNNALVLLTIFTPLALFCITFGYTTQTTPTGQILLIMGGILWIFVFILTFFI